MATNANWTIVFEDKIIIKNNTLEYFKFLYKDKMNNCLIELSKAGDYYRNEPQGCYGIDFMEYLFDFTPIKTKYKHRCVFNRFETIADLYNHSLKIKDRFN